jgi:hypothetical protein
LKSIKLTKLKIQYPDKKSITVYKKRTKLKSHLFPFIQGESKNIIVARNEEF